MHPNTDTIDRVQALRTNHSILRTDSPPASRRDDPEYHNIHNIRLNIHNIRPSHAFNFPIPTYGALII